MVVLDVVEDILSRLLVKDLLPCKSVCKSWYSLISTPSFVETHRKFMCHEEDINTRRIAMITFYKDPETVLHEYNIPQEWRSYDKWDMVGSCNGLVCICLTRKAQVCVTNPLTREFNQLPRPPKGIHKKMLCLGFGYDSSTDDYKVVMAISQGIDKALVRILSLKSNIWKLFGEINYRFEDFWIQMPGILFNGALHWFWNNCNDIKGGSKLLVSFDLAKEEFREITQPDDSRYIWNCGYSLGIIEGRLCIFLASDEYPSCGTWVMKSNNSWELFPKDCEMVDHAIHYMLKDSKGYRITPPQTYFCDENVQMSSSKMYIKSPMFVRTLVSPNVNNTSGPSHAKNNKNTTNTAESVQLQEKREIEEVYSVEEKKKRRK